MFGNVAKGFPAYFSIEQYVLASMVLQPDVRAPPKNGNLTAPQFGKAKPSQIDSQRIVHEDVYAIYWFELASKTWIEKGLHYAKQLTQHFLQA